MTKILVVDDIPIFRDSIAAALTNEHYEVFCAVDGREALELIRQKNPDIVLLDVAMPNMDGLTCLKAIRRDPGLRDIPVIMLTAMSEKEMVVEAAKTGVQGYLLKSQFSLDDMLEQVKKHIVPESGNKAEAIQDREVVLPASHSEAETRGQILRKLQLIGMPPVLHHVLSLTRSDASSMAEIANAVRQDQALACRVMRVANSTYYGHGRTIESLTEAAQRIGVTEIRNIVVAILSVDKFGSTTLKGLDAQRFWEHALATAMLAQLIDERVHLDEPEHLFVSGLLHDMGRMIMALAFPEEYADVLSYSAQSGGELTTVERRVFSLNHTDITREVLKKWKTPRHVIECASLHEHAISEIHHLAQDYKGSIVIGLADRIAHALALGNSGNPTLRPFREYAKVLELSREDICSVASEAVQKAQDMRLFYAVRSEQEFTEPLIDNLKQQIEGEVKLSIFAEEGLEEALSLFCTQLGWLDTNSPEIAVIQVSEESHLDQHFEALKEREERAGVDMHGVVIISPRGSVSPSPELLGTRSCSLVRMPLRYSNFVDAVAQVVPAKCL